MPAKPEEALGFHRSQSASPHPAKRKHLETRGASPGQQQNTSCTSLWYCQEPRGRIHPLLRDSVRVKMRKQKKPILQKEQVFYTPCSSKMRVSAAANAKEHVPEVHAPGAPAQPRTECVTATLSTIHICCLRTPKVSQTSVNNLD